MINKGVKGIGDKKKSKDILNIEQKKSYIIKEINKKRRKFKKANTKSLKNIKFEKKKKDIQEWIQEKLKIKVYHSHNIL